jgi:hypothetical protein
MKTEKEIREKKISDELIPVIQKHYQELLHWTSMDKKPIKDYNDLKCYFRKGMITYYLDGEKWWDNHNKIGGFEMISFKIQNIALDTNHDGVIDSDELEESKENRTKLIEQCLSQLLNYGVIGGLAVSVLYAVSLNSLTPSESTLYYLNHPTILAFYYIFYTCLYYSMTLSFLLIYKSSRAYLQLSLWMPTLDMKHWYISEISMKPFIFTTIRIIEGLAVSIPFGATVSISPAAGVIAVSFLLMFYVEMIQSSKLDVFLGYKIHDLAKKMIGHKLAYTKRKCCLEEIKFIVKKKKGSDSLSCKEDSEEPLSSSDWDIVHFENPIDRV